MAVSTFSTFPPLPGWSKMAMTSTQHLKEIRQLVIGGNRAQSRALQELRPIRIQTSYLHDATGSSYVRLGKTKIICAIYGPRPSGRAIFKEKASLNLDICIVPPDGKRTITQDPEVKQMERLLIEAMESVILLDRYPKAVIDVRLMILEDDGGTLSASFTSIGLALMDAHISVIDVVVAASVYAISPEDVLDKNVRYVVDLDDEEIQAFKDSKHFTEFHMGLCLRQAKVCFLHAIGPHLGESHIQQLIQLAEATCEMIGNGIRTNINMAQGKNAIEENNHQASMKSV